MAKTQVAESVVEKQQIKHVEKESSALQQSLSKLAKAGGFSFLESTIDGVANLNPDRKARKQIFLTDEDKKKDRENLLKTLNLWIGWSIFPLDWCLPRTSNWSLTILPVTSN